MRRQLRDSRINRDRHEDSFARAVIAEAERRRQLEAAPPDLKCCNGNDPACPTHGIAASNTRQSDFYRKHEEEPWVSPPDEEPLGDCPHCSSAYYDEQERQYHADAECIGGMERFR